jgi:maltooligosyltrehalose trehalohydrolase
MAPPGPARLGATLYPDNQCSFLVWAPLARTVDLYLEAPDRRLVPMEKADHGYFYALLNDAAPDNLYFYCLDGTKKRPDPASRFQPNGVHGPSQVKDSCNFRWTDSGWAPPTRSELVFYEVHVGTFTPEGTFEAIIPRLRDLKSLGINTIELMPVAQFPGTRNWGYDGVYPFAVQDSYGGPEGLKRLVNACHQEGIGLALDVVYNHLGPEGNYLAEYGPYFTNQYRSPWGEAINFDGPLSDEVRRFFIENALYWISEFHVDALRLDAVHAIIDASAQPFLEELMARVRELEKDLKRTVYVIAESDRNDARILKPREKGGYAVDGQWNDDFHHALHALLTGERTGYYEDFGSIRDMAKAYSEGFVYSGQYSKYRRRRHGNSSRAIASDRFVVFCQNHDQVGNRARGERLAALVSDEALRLAAGTVLLAPFVPLLFMGEEYGEISPFQYFVSHSDAELIQNVRDGRREDFAGFHWDGAIPDPQSEDTFVQSKVRWERRENGRHQKLLYFYSELLRVRRTVPALRNLDKSTCKVSAIGSSGLVVERWCEEDRVFTVFNFGGEPSSLPFSVMPGIWNEQIDSSDHMWGGARNTFPRIIEVQESARLELPAHSFSLFRLGKGDPD